MILLKQILRLKLNGETNKSIVRQTLTSKNTVKKYLRLVEVNNYSFIDLLAMEDPALELLFTPQQESRDKRIGGLETLLPYFEVELNKTGVNRWVLWGEYRKESPSGYSYSQFCFHLQQWLKQQSATMHFEHVPGEKLFIDFTGKKLSIVDKDTGEITELEVFVAVLGYSQMAYVEAVRSQRVEEFIKVTENSLHYFGGTPKVIIPDNLKSAVTKACRYEPEINQAFNDFANHYGTTIMPTRSRKPKDKALVEGGVKIAYSRIFAPLRNEIFFNVTDLNIAIKERLLEYNKINFQRENYSRLDRFQESEKAALSLLPDSRYDLKKYLQLTVGKNCHIQIREDKCYYSVPNRYIGVKVKIVYTLSTVSIYHQNVQVAFHPRSFRNSSYSTTKDHLPSHHQFIADWSAEKFISWAATIDNEVKKYIEKVIESKPFPEQAYKSCNGILVIGRKAGKEKLVNACKAADSLGVYNYSFIKRLLENKCIPFLNEKEEKQLTIPYHENVRGPECFK